MIVLLAAYHARSRWARGLLSAAIATCIATGVYSPRFPDSLACDGRSSGWQEASRSWPRDVVTYLPICPNGWTVKAYPRREPASP